MKYQPPGITEEIIMRFLEKNFSMKFIGVRFLPLGAGSWLYEITDKNKNIYLLKLNKTLSPELINALVYINNLGKVDTLDFVQTAGNEFILKIEGYAGILFEYIDGYILGDTNVKEFQWKELGKLLATLHQTKLPNEFLKTVYMEDFIKFRTSARRIIEHAYIYKGNGIVETELVNFIKAHIKKIEDYFLQGKILRKRLKDIPLVVTHGDAHPWNVMTYENKCHFIDWDGLGMALPEKDLMHYEHKKNWTKVLEGYKEISPDFNLNKDAIKYYRIEWILQEITDYGNTIFFEDIAEKNKKEALTDLEEYF